MVAANLAERRDDVLVLHTGYFADSFADCFETYGVTATQLKAPIGDRPQLPEIEKALKEKKYKLITVTHVDTSTGVLSEIENLSKMVHRVSPDTLIVVDGVCSVGCEEIRFDDWGIDVVLTASQKAIGCPAGLCIMMCSGRAIESFRNRKTPPSSYFASFKNWLPSKREILLLPPAPFLFLRSSLVVCVCILLHFDIATHQVTLPSFLLFPHLNLSLYPLTLPSFLRSPPISISLSTRLLFPPSFFPLPSQTSF